MIYANGDSHTAGIGVPVKLTFSQIVADHLQCKLVNDAVVGSSNARILRTTKEFLSNHTPKLIVIGWSTWEREEWFYNGQYYDVNSSGHSNLPTELVNKYKKWVVDQTPNVVDQKSSQLHKEIYELHCLLKDKNIPHVFFNCMYNFFSVEDKKDWKYCYIDPYKNDSSYYWYLKNKGFTTDDWYHYKQDGHRAWANFLIDHINKYDIIH